MEEVSLESVVEEFCKSVEKEITDVFNVVPLNELQTEFAILFTDGTYLVMQIVGNTDKNKLN
jgi:hypothetical protein